MPRYVVFNHFGFSNSTLSILKKSATVFAPVADKVTALGDQTIKHIQCLSDIEVDIITSLRHIATTYFASGSSFFLSLPAINGLQG